MIAHDHAVNRGRVRCGARSYRDGFAPCQLPEYIRADCGRCGGRETLVVARGGAYCVACSPVIR